MTLTESVLVPIWRRYAKRVTCPECGQEREILKYRVKGDKQLCRRCSSTHIGLSKKGIKQNPKSVAKRVKTNHETGVTNRLIKQLAIHNTGRKASEEHRAAISASNRQRKLSVETRAKIAQSAHERWGRGRYANVSLGGHGRNGKRPDLGGQFFRSTWEANYARMLSACGIQWEYESRVFHLADGRNYIPDFRAGRWWIEIKGYMRPDDEAKIKAFRAEYPDEILVLVDAKIYKGLEREWKGKIPEWE